MRILIIITVLLYSCSIGPSDNIDYTDPEVMRAYDETVLGIKKSRFIDEPIPVYSIKTDTLGLWPPHTMVLLLTVMKNGEAVYDEVRYEDLCPWKM
jgi:hypothetical protein